MKKILLFSLILCSFVAKAQNPLVGKPSLKLVYDVAQTKKWDFTVDTNNMLEINGTGGTPSIRFTDFAGTGTSLLTADADGDLTRITNGSNGTFLSLSGGVPTWAASPTTPPGGSTTQVQYNNAGAFGGASTFVFDGSGNVDITGSLDVDNININGNVISSTTGTIDIVPTGTQNVRITNGGALLLNNSSSIIVTPRIYTSDGGSTSQASYYLNNDINTGIYQSATDNIDMTAGGVRVMNWNSSNVLFPLTTNQLVLGTTNTTTINSTAPSASRVATLPDYGADANIMQATTGTFTPSISPNSGSFTTLTYSVQYGRYTRKQITSTIYETKVDITLTVSALTIGTASGQLTINVPYNSITESNLIQVGQIHIGSTDFDAGYTAVIPRILNASSSMQLRQTGDNVASAALNAAHLTSSSSIQISLTYLSL